ncbi:unnamed protein product [Lactuca virosa]|uniref:Uncharacterized protein n=1 Tax=Lactuca virosa TaxID=75947 RepID=A0AAU9PB08_9ASTR|nr:unnamed protein product [Lactuca virosa]
MGFFQKKIRPVTGGGPGTRDGHLQDNVSRTSKLGVFLKDHFCKSLKKNCLKGLAIVVHVQSIDGGDTLLSSPMPTILASVLTPSLCLHLLSED